MSGAQASAADNSGDPDRGARAGSKALVVVFHQVGYTEPFGP